MKYYSQDGQDKLVDELLKFKHKGIFVDIGAYDGISFSNTYFFEKYRGWNGICIEPNPTVFEKLKANRNCICANYAISDFETTYKFLSISGYGEMLSGILEFFDKRHIERINDSLLKHGGKKEILNISAIPLNILFKNHNLKEIDYCNIDVEGGELNVLKSINFDLVKIGILTVENNYGSDEVKQYLKTKGYSLLGKSGADEVYEFNSKRYGKIIKWKISKVYNILNLHGKTLLNKFKVK